MFWTVSRAMMIAPQTPFAVWEEEWEDEETGELVRKSHTLTLQEFVMRAVAEQMMDDFGSMTNTEFKEELDTYGAGEREVPTGHCYSVRFIGMLR